MSKNLLIGGGVVILLLVVGGLAYSKMGKAPQSLQQAVQQAVTKKSLKDLVLAGLPVTCTIKSGSDQTAVSGTTFVSGKKMRSDFSSTVDGKTTAGHMIQDSTFAYMWTDGNSQGTKIKIDVAESANQNSGNAGSPGQNNAPSAPTGGVDVNEKVDMNCNPWVPDDSKFAPPGNVQFMDLSQMMQNLPKTPNIPNVPNAPTPMAPPSGY